MYNNSITKLFKIQYPIIQGGMIWVSGGKLAAAVSNAGGLGLVGAGSMKPELLALHIQKALALTTKPIGVNIPLLYEKSDQQIKTALDQGIKIFFTSAGNPKQFTSLIHDHGGIVVHVASNPEQALKCEAAGVDAVVAEGFEAGGHNGREEITSLVLIPLVRQSLKIPLISAGGIATGSAIAAAMALGADGVQIGTRFLMTQESSAHLNFKNLIINSKADYTRLLMKAHVPVRLLKNKFSDEIYSIEQTTFGEEQKKQIIQLLGSGRAKNGMHDGDTVEGELEAGQVAALIKDLPSCQELINTLVQEYNQSIKNLQPF
jgi:enoyl-[acyl-carrier protein] reductase II